MGIPESTPEGRRGAGIMHEEYGDERWPRGWGFSIRRGEQAGIDWWWGRSGTALQSESSDPGDEVGLWKESD